MTNNEIADHLELLAKLMEIHGENTFKTRAYSSAAFSISKFPDQLKDIPRDQIASIKGIGDNTGKKICEILDTGKFPLLEQYLTATPPGILDMLSIKGLGPKKIQTIWREMEIESIGELLYACNENRLLLYKGFGEKTQQNVKEAIEFHLNHKGQFLYAQAEEFMHEFSSILSETFPENRFEISADFRRQMETITQLEWVTDIDPLRLREWMEKKEMTVEVLEKSLTVTDANSMKNIFHQCSHQNFGNTLFVTTGPATFTDHFGQALRSDNLFENEEAIFRAAGIEPVPAFLRDLWVPGGTMPENLINQSDIRGIIHSHSQWSDGTHSLKEMAVAARDAGLEYLVISDHSKIAFYANGLSEERILAQHKEIDLLNKELSPFRIFKSIEADILSDGSLDYAPEILATFDLVIASIHSNLKMSEDKANARLIKAIENPYTRILGHMTGRLLLSRNGYPVDHQKIIDACVANQVVIELNAHPRRLDMDWRWIRKALDKGVLISIDPDAHSIEGFKDVRYGVLAAQKAAVKPKENLSSFTLTEFQDFLSRKR